MDYKRVLAALALACVFLGCGERNANDSAVSKPDYMHDKVFMKTLDERRVAADKMIVRRAKLVDELEAAKAEPANAALAKELQKKLDKYDLEFEAHRRETFKIVRERLQKNGGSGK